MAVNDHTSPREQLRYDLRERFRELTRALVERVDTEAIVTSEVDPDGQGKHLWSNVPVLTMPSLNEALRGTFEEPLPAPSELTAELHTPGTVFVAAECPECHVPQQIPMVIDVKLEVEGAVRTLHLKGKSKAAVHRCGQLPLPEAKADERGQEELPWEQSSEEPGEVEEIAAEILALPAEQAAAAIEAVHALALSGSQIRAVRLAAGLSQTDVARGMCVTRQRVGNLEEMAAPPTAAATRYLDAVVEAAKRPRVAQPAGDRLAAADSLLERAASIVAGALTEDPE
jgi:DNA-binding transcriptional regulator YiaG